MATTLPYQEKIKFPHTGAYKADVIRQQFGGGYTQRIAKGYNNVVGTFSITWTDLREDEMQALNQVFLAGRGVSLYSWRPPGDTALKTFSVAETNYTQIAQSYYEYTATLVQEFDPS